MRTLALFFMNIRALTRNDKGLLVGKPMVFRPDIEYIGLDLTLIGCMEIFAGARLEL